MESFKITIGSIIIVMLLPFLTFANPTESSSSSKPYCNMTNYFARTSIEEVDYTIKDALAELNHSCRQNEVVCKYSFHILYSGFLSWIQTCVKLNYNNT